MSKKIIRLPILLFLMTLVSLLFTSVKTYANEIETPVDEPIVEEYDVVYSYYYNYHDTMFYPTYDAFYLISSNYEEYLEEIYGNDYKFVYGTIKVVVRTGYSTAPFRVALKNWYNSPNEYCGITNNLTNYYYTETYYYHFGLNLNFINNSLCVYFTCSSGNPRLYDVEVNLSFSQETTSNYFYISNSPYYIYM